MDERTEREQQRKRELEERRADAKDVMRTPAGRRVMNRLFERCGVLRMTDSVVDGGRLQYMAGRRDAALELFELVAVMPEYALMRNENAREAK